MEKGGRDGVARPLEVARHAGQDLAAGLSGDAGTGIIGYKSGVLGLGDGLAVAAHKLGHVSRVDVHLVLQVGQQSLCGGIAGGIAHRV